MHLGAQVALETIERIVEGDGQVDAIPQEQLMDGQTLHAAPKIFKETCRIDWNLPAKRIYDFVRGLSPYPGAWTTMRTENGGEQQVVKIFKTTKVDKLFDGLNKGALVADGGKLFVVTMDGALRIDTLQMAGKKRMEASAFLNGLRNVDSLTLE